MLFSSYIVNVYNGNIWVDEFMLGAIARMFDIKIMVISPAYDDVWNVFHQSGLPHVVIVSNGGDFGEKWGITHFLVTKGLEWNWKCVGADLNVGEMEKMSGFKKGREYMVDKLYEKEKAKLLDSTKKMAMNIQELCRDLNALCVWRNQIFEEMAQIWIDIDDFKRFNTFYYEVAPTEVEPEPVHKKKHKKKKEHREKKGEKSKRSARSCGQFPRWSLVKVDVRSNIRHG